jgi:molybdopterin converting factor small subunit
MLKGEGNNGMQNHSRRITMKIQLKCFSTLVDPDTCHFNESTHYDLEDGQTVNDLVQRAGIAAEAVKIAFVNSRIVGLDKVLSDGDQVGLAPAVGGM